MECCSKEGDTPVCEIRNIASLHQSTVGHEKPRGNMGGPPSKAKYYSTTDSEPVPWGKGEKNPDKGSEIDPETLCLQAVEAPHESDRVPFA